MKARKLIEGASFDPEQLKVISAAFNDAWESIAPTISDHATAREDARLKLAEIILALASNRFRDARQLADAALEMIRRPPTGIG